MPNCKDLSCIRLIQWMKYNGFCCRQSVLQPSEFPDTGRGIRARKRIASGDVIVRIPRKMLLTTQVVFSSHLGDLIKRYPLKFSPTQVLGLYLISERLKGDTSFWKNYIDSLPAAYTNAVYWTDEDIQLLPERLRFLFRDQYKHVYKLYEQLCDFVLNIKDICPALHKSFTFESFRWAWSTINTRSVYMLQSKSDNICDGETDHYALVPLLDLLNHTSDVEVKAGFCDITQSYTIKAVTETSKNNQVFINYGPHSNIKLLVEYGFALPNNLNNTYPVYLDDLEKLVDEVDVHDSKEKLHIISEKELHKDMFISNDGLSWNLRLSLTILSLEHINRDEVKRIISGHHRHEDLSYAFSCNLLRLLQNELNIACNKGSFLGAMASQIVEDSRGLLQIAVQDVNSVGC